MSAATPCRLKAGVICCARHPDTHEWMILLGQDRWRKGWFESNTWSDFGGGMQPRDTGRAIVTAAREFVEETLGLVRLDGKDTNETCTNTAAEVQELQLANPLPMFETPNVSTYYLREIPFDEMLPERYHECWFSLNTLRERARESHRATCLTESRYLKRGLFRMYNSFPLWIKHHPCIRLDYTPHGTLHNIWIPAECLEKCAIQWFSLSGLHLLMHVYPKIFRHSFLPVLQQIVNHLEKEKV